MILSSFVDVAVQYEFAGTRDAISEEEPTLVANKPEFQGLCLLDLAMVHLGSPHMHEQLLRRYRSSQIQNAGLL